MGIQNKPSLARKRLSTLAVTTTLAAVGVGVIGTGAANAATTSGIAHSQADSAASTTTLDFTVAPGSDSLTATLDVTGAFDTHTASADAKVTVDWGDSNSTAITVKSDLSLDKTKLSHTYPDAKKYTVTLKVEDGIAAAHDLDKTHDVTVVAAPVVQAPTLVADVSTKTPVANSPVVVKLAGSTIDPSAKDTAQTTIKWGDTATDSVIKGDPAVISAADAKLSHTYAAGSYKLTVTLDDGLKGHTPQAQTFDITVTAAGKVTVLRAAGDDRYATGLLISKHQWADNGTAATDATHRMQAKAVVLATGNAFPDALAGVPLAKKAGGPLLLTNGSLDTVNPDVVKEIQRVLPAGSKIYILGGEKAMSAGIEKQLNDLKFTVKRLAGEDRFGTALAIAGKDGMGDPTHIIVARVDNGEHNDGFADARAAGPFAANQFDGGDGAIVLSNGKTLDAATSAYIKARLQETKADVPAVQVAAIGGPAVTATKTVPGAVLLDQDKVTKKWSGNFAGAVGWTRYDTAAMVAARFDKSARVGLATGLAYPDALTGGAYMANAGGPLLLTDPKVLSPATEAALKTVAATTSGDDIFGGDKAVAPPVATAGAAIVKVATIGKF
ncbi:MAG: hypothetical protein HOV83_36255, partial [Catenulispora sp.]|nr:hypothetical protein [Catenulispora sp.]